MAKYTKYKRILLSVLAINALLVSTHEGEFWPFSIFPMFSQGGHPWTRGVVQELDTITPDVWDVKPLEEVRPGVISLDAHGIDQIDYANFMSKTKVWDQKRLRALAGMLQASKNISGGKYWLLTRVEGFLTEEDSVVVNAIPMFLVSADTLIKNPNIFNPQKDEFTH